MAGIDPPGVERARDAEENESGSGAAADDVIQGGTDDPAASAAHMIADQALSIFEAVEAKATEIDTRAHRDAEEIRREAMAVVDPASARLDAITRQLDTVSTDLERLASERAGGGE
jgi:hypothetical protein